MRGLAGAVVLVAISGCDLVFPPGPGPLGDDDVPPGDWVATSAGFEHACGVDASQRLWCWGHNNAFQIGDGSQTDHPSPVVIDSAGTWRAVSAGQYHTCGIQTNDRLYCWGDDIFGELGTGVVMSRSTPTEISNPGPWEKVIAGSRQTCAIQAGDGSLWCWGGNDRGQLGNGAPGTDSADPVQVGGAGPWLDVAIAYRATCAVTEAGSMWCWGENDYGELGEAGPVEAATPRQVGVDLGWQAVAGGGATFCGLRDGAVMCWGYNAEGACGSGAITTTATPAAIDAPIGPWSSVDVGSRHACATTAGGQLWCWGRRQRGALGDGDDGVGVEPTPLAVGLDTAWKSVATGGDYTCATRTSDGVLECAGTNGFGQLGDGVGGIRWAPVQVSAPGQTATVIAAGGADGEGVGFSCAAMNDGVHCWGVSSRGQLGAGDDVPRRKPFRRDGANPERLHAGGKHACEVRSGELYCWGYNAFSQLGLGTTTDEPSPMLVNGSAWTSVEAGQIHTCAIRADELVFCWGANEEGQLGAGVDDIANRDTPTAVYGALVGADVSVGFRHSCFVDIDTSLYCMGRNAEGQLGLGDQALRTIPTGLGGTWSDVDAGSNYTCGLDTAGIMSCWGRGGFGSLGNGTLNDATSPVPVSSPDAWAWLSAGGYQTCGIKLLDQSLWCWGANWWGQAGLGVDVPFADQPTRVGQDTWHAVSAGENHTCGIKSDGTVWCWGLNAFGEVGDDRAWRPVFGPVIR